MIGSEKLDLLMEIKYTDTYFSQQGECVLENGGDNGANNCNGQTKKHQINGGLHHNGRSVLDNSAGTKENIQMKEHNGQQSSVKTGNAEQHWVGCWRCFQRESDVTRTSDETPLRPRLEQEIKSAMGLGEGQTGGHEGGSQSTGRSSAQREVSVEFCCRRLSCLLSVMLLDVC